MVTIYLTISRLSAKSAADTSCTFTPNPRETMVWLFWQTAHEEQWKCTCATRAMAGSTWAIRVCRARHRTVRNIDNSREDDQDANHLRLEVEITTTANYIQ